MTVAENRKQADDAVLRLRERFGNAPRFGIVLGSGLGVLANDLRQVGGIPYGDIPGFPGSGVPGHRGELLVGELGGPRVALLSGRSHFYEGYSLDQVVFPVRVLGLWGVEILIVTNAAGGLNPAYHVGDLMLISDHLNFPGLAGQNPLRGDTGAAFGTRFVDPKAAYDSRLRDRSRASADRLGMQLREGVYAMVAGPSFETIAEVRMLRMLGADAVGMSTVPEVLAARQLGVRVLGISCITNMLLPDAGGPAITSHGEVLETGLAAGPKLAGLVRSVIEEFSPRSSSV